MERATSNSLSRSQQPDESPPATIHVSPSQHLAQLPIAALLAFVPRLRTTYRVLNGTARAPVATGRSHYRLRLGAGQTLYISDNLLDLVRLIDGRRSIQALSDALAEQQCRPVHPAEIVYLLRRQLVPGGLVELSLPLALPEPKSPKPLRLPALVPNTTSTALETPSSGTPEIAAINTSRTTRPLEQTDNVQWIPPGRRAERLRANRRPPPLAQRLRRTSYLSLVATFLVILAAGAAFAFAHSGFSQASFTPINLSTFFGGTTPTVTVVIQHPSTPTATPPPPPIHYLVEKHDTLDSIAARFGVTANALLLVNHMKSASQLHYAQILIIPTVYHQGTDPTKLAYPIFYVVQAGDSISSIADFFGSTSDILTKLNHIANPSLIQPGDTLVIPAPTPSSNS